MRAPLEASFEPSQHTPSDQTKLIAPRERRTPLPQRAVSPRPATAPPPMPVPQRGGRGPTPGPPVAMLPTTLPGAAPIAPAMAPLPQPPGPLPPTPQPQNLGISGGPALPFQPAPPAAGYPQWGAAIAPQRPMRDATPTSRDSFDRPVFPNRASQPQVAGFGAQKKKGLMPWMLVVGALIMALLAFAITRAFIG